MKQHTSPDLWRCPRCGLPARICGGACQRRAHKIASAALALVLLAAPLHAPHTDDAPGPIIAPGPCHSDTPWGCYPYRLFVPLLVTP